MLVFVMSTQVLLQRNHDLSVLPEALIVPNSTPYTFDYTVIAVIAHYYLSEWSMICFDGILTPFIHSVPLFASLFVHVVHFFSSERVSTSLSRWSQSVWCLALRYEKVIRTAVATTVAFVSCRLWAFVN